MAGDYRLQCEGGPFDGQTVRYTDLPKTLVLMEYPFRYHDYARQGDSNVYRYVEEERCE
jgi:hypothetical protein